MCSVFKLHSGDCLARPGWSAGTFASQDKDSKALTLHNFTLHYLLLNKVLRCPAAVLNFGDLIVQNTAPAKPVGTLLRQPRRL